MILTFAKDVTAWNFNSANISDLFLSKADLRSPSRTPATFFFPTHYFNGLPNILLMNLALTAERTGVIKTWAIFLDLMMWLTTLIQFILAIDVAWLRPREVPIAQYAAAIALVFSLPGIRSSEPGIPPVGIVADVAGFFWNEILSLGATVVLLSASYGQYSYGGEMRKKHEEEQKAKEEEERKVKEAVKKAEEEFEQREGYIKRPSWKDLPSIPGQKIEVETCVKQEEFNKNTGLDLSSSTAGSLSVVTRCGREVSCTAVGHTSSTLSPLHTND